MLGFKAINVLGLIEMASFAEELAFLKLPPKNLFFPPKITSYIKGLLISINVIGLKIFRRSTFCTLPSKQVEHPLPPPLIEAHDGSVHPFLPIFRDAHKEDPVGFEPTTKNLKDSCSTTELRVHRRDAKSSCWLGTIFVGHPARLLLRHCI